MGSAAGYYHCQHRAEVRDFNAGRAESVSWLSLVLAVLEIASKLLQIGQEQKWISEGQSQEVAKAAAEVARKTKYAKRIAEEMSARSNVELDDFLRSLEPRDTADK